MAKDNIIGLAMGLDVTDLKAGINEVKKIVKSSKDEFNVATAGLDKWTQSANGLTAKLKQLDKQLEAQNKAVAGYKAEIERVSQLEGDHSIQLEQLKKKLTDAEIAVKKTEVQINKYKNSLANINAETKKAESSFGQLTSEIEKQQKQLSELEFEYKDTVLTYGKNSKEAKKLAKEITKLSGELAENKSKATQSDKALQNLEKQLNDTEEEAKDLSKAFDNIKGIGAGVAKGIGAVGVAVGGLATAFFATAESTRELRTNMGKVETAFATVGLSAEQAKQTYTDLYAVVADEGKATEATSHIAKLAKSQEDLTKWVNISTGVYATFGDSLPIENLAEASNETAKTGKIVGGLADALNWAGVSEEQFQEQLDNLSTEQERNQLITETLNGLYSEASLKYQQTNKDVIESNKAQAELSNTMAQLGEKAEPILTTIKEGFNQVLQAIIELLNGADFEAIKAGIENAFAYFIDTIIPAIVNGFQWIMDNKDILIAGIVAIGTAMLAWNVVTIIQGVVGAVKGWTVAQTALNVALNANPIGIIITAIAGLTAGFIALWNNCDAFRQFWIDLWEGLKRAVMVVVDWIKENWQALLLFLVNPVAGVFKYLYDNFEGFRNFVDKILEAVKQFFINAWEGIKNAWSSVTEWFSGIGSKISSGFQNVTGKIKNFFSDSWEKTKQGWSVAGEWFKNVGSKISSGFKNATNKVKNYFSDSWEKTKQGWRVAGDWFADVGSKISKGFNATTEKMKNAFSKGWENTKKSWGVAGEWFSNIGSKIVNGFKSIPEKIKNFFTNAWNNVKFAWNNPTQFFTEVKDKIINAFKTLPSKLLEVGKNLIEGLWNGIKSMGAWIGGKVKDFGNTIVGGFKSIFGIHSPSTVMAEIGNYMVEGMAKGISDNADKVTNASKKLGNKVLASYDELAKEIEKKDIADKMVELGGKVKNPFAGWTHEKINNEINKLNAELAKTNDQLIANGIVQEQWSSSYESMDERATLLKKRFEEQNTLLDAYNKKLEYYQNQGVDVPEWVTKGFNDVKNGIQQTIDEAQELGTVLGDNVIPNLDATAFDALNKTLESQRSELDKLNNEYKSAVLEFGEGSEEAMELANKIETLTGEIKENEDKVKLAEQALSNMTEEMGKEPKSPWKQWLDDFEEALDKSEEKMKDWEKGSGRLIGKVADKMEEVSNSLSDFGGQIFDALSMIWQNQVDKLEYENEKFIKQKDEEIAVAEENAEVEMDTLDQLLADKTISEEEYKTRKIAIETELAKQVEALEAQKRASEEKTLREVNKLQEKEFKAQKANDIAQATINGALGVTRLYSRMDPLSASIAAVGLLALVGLQIKAIKEQEFMPALAKGGIVNSPTIAMIGEAGKEAVIPLENNTGWINDLAEKISAVMQKNYSVQSFGFVGNTYGGDTTINNNYQQIINAPKLPTRKEIYRDTKNLLALKGV